MNRFSRFTIMKFLSIDIELSDIFELEKHEDMEKYAPFHISVAATVVHNGEERLWYAEGEGGRPDNPTRGVVKYAD